MKLRKIIFIILYLLLAILMSMTVIRGFTKVKTSQEQAMIHDIQENVNQRAEALSTEILQEQRHLLECREIIAQESLKGKTVDEIIDILKPIADIDGFIRISIADDKGIAHTSDGFVMDIGFRDFYQEAMKGNMFISGRIMDSILEVDGDIIVFSAPLYNKDNSISGVVFETIDAEEFHRQLDLDALGNTGGSAIVDAVGDVVIATDRSPIKKSDNLFEYLGWITNGKYSKRNASEAIKDISGSAHINDTYIFYSPIDLKSSSENWYIITIVSSEILKIRLGEIMYDVPRMMGICACFLCMAFLLYMIDRHYSRKENVKALNAVAYIDPLTKGDNYNAFKRNIEKIHSNGYIVSMDIHAFKAINSMRGMKAGDRVIIRTWEIISSGLREQEAAAHINADHFVMLLNESEDSFLIERLTDLTVKMGSLATELDTPQVVPYFGICEWKVGDSVVETENKAITARREVKASSERNYEFFTKEHSDKMLEDKKIEDAFEDAIDNEEFQVWFQPKYNPENDTIIGAEALVRWKRMDGTLLPPYKFIPLFERNGNIKKLDEYMYRKVCEYQREWIKNGVDVVPISVNLSRASIYFGNVAEKYHLITCENEVKPNLVPIEITESAAVDDGVIKAIVNSLNVVGFPLHMDDFGSGYSSLASLVRLKFDTVKIDKSLIDTIGESAGENLISHSIRLAKELGLKVTAEGVEEKEQVEFLRDLGCDSIQGYYYSKPVPYEVFDSMIREDRKDV